MSEGALSLLDWRRRVSALYATVRQTTDPASAHQLWRAGRDELFSSHPESPLPPGRRQGFAGLAVAPYDPAVRFEVELDAAIEPDRIRLATGTAGGVTFRRLGRLDLTGIGPLDVWWLDAYGGGMFVPIKDGLAGSLTYGGGRYVLDTVKGADLGGVGERLVIDLNFAYNPSCAYDPAWACPLAPPGNVVGVGIRAGELMTQP